MSVVEVRYRVRPECAADNEALVRAVYAELAAVRPAGLRYMTFLEPDGVSFVHVAVADDALETHPLTTRAAFRAFQAGLAERCEVVPVVRTVREIGTYGAG